MTIALFGICNPIMDVLMNVKPTTVSALGLTPGSMNLVQDEEARQKLESLQATKELQPGGSVANTIFMLSQLGLSCAFSGSIGNDQLGKTYIKLMQQKGIQTYFSLSNSPTGTSTILITPDGQRTMNTYLGACTDFSFDLSSTEAIKQATWLYVSAYMWDSPKQQKAIREIFSFAKTNNIPIAFSLSDTFCVERHKAEFKELIQEYVSLVFCNQEEAASLTDEQTIRKQVTSLRSLCQEVVITQGKEGAVIADTSTYESYKALPIQERVDTTGAGDSFAAGYLYGKLTGKAQTESAQLASACASVIIQQIGARFNGDFKQALTSYLAIIEYEFSFT